MPVRFGSILHLNNSGSEATLDSNNLKGTTIQIDKFSSASLASIGAGLTTAPGKRRLGTIVATTGSADNPVRYYAFGNSGSGDINLSGSEWSTLTNWKEIALHTNNVIFNNITASVNISASGLLFASASLPEHDDNIVAVVYDKGSGRFYYTGSYGSGGGGGADNLGNHIATQDLDMAGNSISASLNITASGNISASGNLLGGGITINGNATFNSNVIDLGVDENDRINANSKFHTRIHTTQNITSSLNISASGDIFANSYQVNGFSALDTDQGESPVEQGRVFGDPNIVSIQIGRQGTPNKNIELLGPVTASNHISASGDIFAKRLRLPSGNTTDVSGIIFDEQAGNSGFIHDDGVSLQIGYNDTDILTVSSSDASVFGVKVVVNGSTRIEGEQLVVEGNITSSGAIHALSHITSSGNISASNDVLAQSIRIKSLETTPPAVAGGMFYSASDNYFLGFAE